MGFFIEMRILDYHTSGYRVLPKKTNREGAFA